MKRLSALFTARSALLAACSFAGTAAALAPLPARAVILSSGQGNTTPPSDDPGFFNVSDDGSSLVYLGDSWVLTAAHAQPIGPTTTSSFEGVKYPIIPNTDVLLHNPPGMDLTSTTDLIMYRIDGLPNLPSLNISESTPPINAQVTMIGRGRRREDAITQWNVQMNGGTWTWNEVATGGNYRGYKIQGDDTRETRWGTNRVVNEDPIVGESDPGHTTVVEAGGAKRDVISVLTVWDQFGGTPHEAQAVSGDSGGGVFYKRNGRWELAGIMNAVLLFPNQSQGWSVYGQATTFADLSVYRDEILSIMGNSNYSIPGDINLDGVVSGDGSGPVDSDDLTAFIEGWLTEHPVANIESWKQGDLNQDAIVDLRDYRLLYNAHPDAAAIAPALGVAVGAIPEPASWLLVVCWLPALWWIARRRLGRRS